MLQAARERVPTAVFALEDISRFAREVDEDPIEDLLFANASLHWVPDHPRLLPRLLRRLRRGGVLAVQMPDNLDEPSHRLMREVAGSEDFRDRLGSLGSGRDALADAGTYYDLLTRDCCAIDIWTTRYLHALGGVDEIIAWFGSTGLKPFLDALDPAGQAQFVDRYRARLRDAYPSRRDGRVLLALPRLFIVATRG
jgi:trans-aconitate 2-methyltransferase